MKSWKIVGLGMVGAFLGMMVFTGVSWFYQDVFTVDRSGTIDFRVSNTGSVGIGMQGALDTPGSRLVVKASGTGTTSSALDVQAGDGTSRLFVRDDGNVGIGTTNPGNNKLTIIGTTSGTASASATISQMTRSTTSGTGGIFMAANPTLNDSGTTAALSNQVIRVAYNRLGTGISSAADFLITLVPTISEGTGGALYGLAIEGPSVAASKTLSTWIGINVAAPQGAGTVTNKYAILTDATAGNVGLGRTPSANILEIEGNASKTTAGSWLANSDRRIKTDIQDLDQPIEVIDRLHPVKFRYTDEYRAKHPSIKDAYYYNFIAQEYQKVFPDSVQDDGTGLLQIDTHNVMPYLVAAVKELKAENQALKNRLSAQEQNLEERLKTLETKLQ